MKDTVCGAQPLCLTNNSRKISPTSPKYQPNQPLHKGLFVAKRNHFLLSRSRKVSFRVYEKPQEANGELFPKKAGMLNLETRQPVS